MSIGFPKPTKEQRKLETKLRKAEAKLKRAKQLTLPQLKEKVQRIVNKRIRERDMDKPCISCNRFVENKDAGHFWAQGSKGILRYHPDNIHGQCRTCNSFKHGNLLEYRINLIKRIGEKRVKWLEDNKDITKKWTREELEAIINKKY